MSQLDSLEETCFSSEPNSAFKRLMNFWDAGALITTPISERSEPWQQPLKISPAPQLSDQNGSNMDQTHHRDTPILISV